MLISTHDKNIYKSLVLIDLFKGRNLYVYAGPESSKLPFKYLDHFPLWCYKLQDTDKEKIHTNNCLVQ